MEGPFRRGWLRPGSRAYHTKLRSSCRDRLSTFTRSNQRNRTISSRCAFAYNWELDVGGSDLGAVFIDVFHPLLMFFEAIGRNANNLDVALRKVGSAAGDLTKLSGAHRCEVSGMREQDGLHSC